MIDLNVSSRFWNKVPDQPGDDCWLWTGYVNSWGYGKFRVNDRVEGAHRVSYMICRGDIPANRIICHACDNPPCVNPSHLFIGSWADNIRDCVSKGRIAQMMRTHCVNGHPFDDINTRVNPNGHRVCKTCVRERARAYKISIRTK